MAEEKSPLDLPEEQPDEEAPQVYSIKKEGDGWKFSRREFLIAAATAAATATGAAMHALRRSQDTAEPDAESAELIHLEMAIPAMMLVSPGQTFVQVWTFTNRSDKSRCHGARLRLLGIDEMKAPAMLDIPEIGPGETVEVPVEMTAPAGKDAYRAAWSLEADEGTPPLASGPFVVLSTCIAESPHPYPNSYNNTWTVTNPDTEAERTRVHFSQLEVETNWDYVYLKDESGQVHQTITGYYSSGLWSVPIPGRVVQVQLTSDSTVQAWGFCLDQIQTIRGICYLPIIRREPTPTPTRTPTPTPTPCKCYGVCTCNPHCTCDLIHYWYPN